MNIFEFARMIGEDIEIVYAHDTGIFTATMRGVFLEGERHFAYAEDAYLTTALLSLCSKMSHATVSVKSDSGIYTLKTPAMLLGVNWSVEP
jgi:hypothetical protein